VAYLSLRMEDVSNIGNVMFCVTFEQQEEHDDDVDDDNIIRLNLLCTTYELIVLSN
jgi:hypothetical protein